MAYAISQITKEHTPAGLSVFGVAEIENKKFWRTCQSNQPSRIEITRSCTLILPIAGVWMWDLCITHLILSL